jgi:hypothetical protein
MRPVAVVGMGVVGGTVAEAFQAAGVPWIRDRRPEKSDRSVDTTTVPDRSSGTGG